MENQYFKGRLKQWNAGKGFGFIQGNHGERDIFIHISALKQMSRPPVVGDIIFYQMHTDNDGKSRAVNAKIKGVAAFKPGTRKDRKSKHHRQNSMSWFDWILPILLVSAGFFLYDRIANNKDLSDIDRSSPNVAVTVEDSYKVNYQCEGKVYCSEMTSCEEAEFYQRNCPGTKMDGDGDGIPCERQWCSW